MSTHTTTFTLPIPAWFVVLVIALLVVSLFERRIVRALRRSRARRD